MSDLVVELQEQIERLRSEPPEMRELVASLQEQIEHLRSELEDWKRTVATRDEDIRCRDAILMNMTEAMKTLNAPQEPRESPEKVAKDAGGKGALLPGSGAAPLVA